MISFLRGGGFERALQADVSTHSKARVGKEY